MKDTNKNSFLTYAIIVLLIVNIVVIGFFVFQKYFSHGYRHGCSPMDKENCMSEFLEKDLNFSNDQLIAFNKLKSEFHSDSKIYFDSLDQIESDFFKELLKPKSDTVILFSYATKFSQLQYQLKHQTIQHLLQIKNICNPEQQKKYFDHVLKNRHCRGRMEMGPPRKGVCPDMMNK